MTLFSKVLAAMLLLISLPFNPATAGDTPSTPEQSRAKETRAWLQLQSDGSQAAPSPKQPGDAASRTYQRYLKTFEHPIPESFFEKQQGFIDE